MIRPHLLGVGGIPMPPEPAVPFIQWLADGSSAGRAVIRDAAVYTQAARFLASGGRYALVHRDDDMIELAAGVPTTGGERGEMVVMAFEVVANGPELLAAVDRLIAASVAVMDAAPILETRQ